MHSGFDDLIKNLFGQTKNNVFEQRAIQRSQKYLSAFENWKQRKGFSTVFKCLKANLFEEAKDTHFFHLRQPTTKGFYFLIEEEEAREYSFLLDLFKEKMQALDYRVNRGIEKFVQQDQYVLRTEQYYLKPALKYRFDLPYEQRYGNLFLEYVEKNNRAFYFKIQVNQYHDRNYKLAHSFDELMLKLLQDE